MNCAVHPDREASGYCRNCGKAMCAECSHRVRDVLYCEDCLARVVGLPATAPPVPASVVGLAPSSAETPVVYAPPAAVPRHNAGPVVAFLLGFIPGLGAIYNGEYNKAIAHIVIFGAIIFGLASDFGEGMQALFIFAVVIFPFY